MIMKLDEEQGVKRQNHTYNHLKWETQNYEDYPKSVGSFPIKFSEIYGQ